MQKICRLDEWNDLKEGNIPEIRERIDELIQHPPKTLSRLIPKINLVPQVTFVQQGVNDVLTKKERRYSPGNCSGFVVDNLNYRGIYSGKDVSKSNMDTFLKEECEPVLWEDSTGKIVVYFSREGTDFDINQKIEAHTHVGILEKNRNILSQWGNYGIFSHPIPLVPTQFGENVGFMRVKKSWIRRFFSI